MKFTLDFSDVPFCGREAELQTLKDALHCMERKKRPVAVFLEGPGGVGKARIAEHFLGLSQSAEEQYIQSSVGDVIVCRAKFEAQGAHVSDPMTPLLECFDQMIHETVLKNAHDEAIWVRIFSEELKHDLHALGALFPELEHLTAEADKVVSNAMEKTSTTNDNDGASNSANLISNLPSDRWKKVTTHVLANSSREDGESDAVVKQEAAVSPWKALAKKAVAHAQLHGGNHTGESDAVVKDVLAVSPWKALAKKVVATSHLPDEGDAGDGPVKETGLLEANDNTLESRLPQQQDADGLVKETPQTAVLPECKLEHDNKSHSMAGAPKISGWKKLSSHVLAKKTPKEEPKLLTVVRGAKIHRAKKRLRSSMIGVTATRVLEKGGWRVKNQDDAENNMYRMKRNNYALRSLWRAVVKVHSVVFLLDAIHFATPEALTLLRSLLTDVSTSCDRRFFMVATVGPLDGENAKLVKELLDGMHTTDQVEKPRVIPVRALTLEDATYLLSRLLHRETTDVRELVELVHRKTAGNVFFTLEFMRLLEQKQLLQYSVATFRWEWEDVAVIAASTALTDNVVEVVANQVRDASQEVKVVLLMAALMGMSQFEAAALFHALPQDEATLQELVRAATSTDSELATTHGLPTEDHVLNALEQAVEQSFLESLGAHHFQFAHDRIREAVISILPPRAQVKKLKYNVGRQLRSWLGMVTTRKNIDVEDDEYRDLVTEVVMLMNEASSFIVDDEERLDLVDLNMEAAMYAADQSSFFPAADFLRTAMDLLEPDPWTDYYDRMLQLSDALMRMEYCCGRLIVSVELADETLQNARQFIDKRYSYQMKILWLTQEGKSDEAQALILQVLDELGSPLPRRFLWAWRFLESARTKRMLRGWGEEQFLSLAASEDPDAEAIASFTELLVEVLSSTSHPDPNLLCLSLLRYMQLTLEYGRHSRTANSLVSWGSFNAHLGRYDLAMFYGKLGVKMACLGMGGDHDARAMLSYYLEIYHWRTPYHSGLKPTSDALQTLWDSGSIEHVLLDTPTYLHIYFCCGLQLEPLMADVDQYLDLITDYGHRLAFETNVSFFQCVSNLMGRSNGGSHLTGEFMEESEMLQDWKKAGNQRALQQSYFYRMILAYIFDDIEFAFEMSCAIWSPQYEGPDVLLPYRMFFQGMASLSMYKKSRSVLHRKQGLRILSLMERWVKGGAVNAHHMLTLLRAEAAAGKSRGQSQLQDFEKTRDLYDHAISMSGRLGFLHIQALGNERAGIYCLEMGETDRAHEYLSHSHTLYSDWGAKGKMRQMTEQYGELLAKIEDNHDVGSSMFAKSRLASMTKDAFKHQNSFQWRNSLGISNSLRSVGNISLRSSGAHSNRDKALSLRSSAVHYRDASFPLRSSSRSAKVSLDSLPSMTLSVPSKSDSASSDQWERVLLEI